MSERFWTTDEQIEKVCSYLSDDRAVAKYFGVPQQRVEHVRSHMRSAPRWLFRSEALETNGSAGTNSHLIAADEAEVGSRRLNDAIQGLFRNFARRHGITSEEARILLLDTGVRLEREAA